MAPKVEVLLEAEARDDEVAAVAAIFADAGMEARVSTEPHYKGAGGDFPWLVAISIPATAFFTTFAAEAAKDAYKNLQGFIQRLYDARKSSKFRTGRVILVDLDTGKSFTLPPQLPDEVSQQLTVAGVEDFALSVFRWDPERGEWREIRYR